MATGPATCVAKGSDVWVGYGKWTAQPADQEAPVDEYHVMHTSNGATLGDVLASDAATKQQNLGALAIDDASGELALTYYASESRPYPHPRSIEAVEYLARKRGGEVGIEYAEAFELIRRVEM